LKRLIRNTNDDELPVDGVYQSPLGKAIQRAVKYALEAGYRHIDTAQIYGNEVLLIHMRGCMCDLLLQILVI
jgi:diketogulonate reductase-like aldo/keto reductase